uniref:DNA double-strand break repair nuclease NurA n=1 Tax=Ammonifex degensii TaxID=42838 RepID=A0A7C2E3B9_9THEO
MLIANEGALAELRRFGEALSGLKRPQSAALRQALARTGLFVQIEPVKPERLVVAVDGSYQTLGAAYPYFLTLVQAVALTLPPRQPLVRHRLFSPLFPEERVKLETRAGGTLPVEVAAESRVRELMAEAELAVASEAARQFGGPLVLLDGGFVHFKARAGALFKELASALAENGGLLVGVIEDVSSRLLDEAVADSWVKDRPAYDREILYGCLAVGEAFILPPEVQKDEGISTVFARFAAHPQPVAFDFLTAQKKEIFWLLGVLRALTPFDGRGVPAVIDIADRYVRLTAAEVEQLVAAAVPPEIRELFLTAHRLRRAL